jgi:hypothetical protein
MRTSEDVLELGVYTSECCNQELVFDVGDTFCRCPRCASLCNWDLESRITPIDATECVAKAEESHYSIPYVAVA